MKLEIRNLSTKRVCKTERMGSIYISKCNKFSYIFRTGICFIAGGIYEGGWSVTDFLSREEENDSSGAVLLWNEEVSTVEDIRDKTYYVSNNYNNYERNKQSVEENIRKVYKLDQINLEEFISMCKFREMGTFDRNINCTGHAFWFYSALFGMALGKNIVTFPWISKQELETQSCRFNLLAELSWKLNCIVIIPVEAEGIANKSNLPHDTKWFEVISMERGLYWN